MRDLTLGYSPCPNDTFIFYALVHGRVGREGLAFREVLEDVETLNLMAHEERLDIGTDHERHHDEADGEQHRGDDDDQRSENRVASAAHLEPPSVEKSRALRVSRAP